MITKIRKANELLFIVMIKPGNYLCYSHWNVIFTV